jgi:hypothetical protein
VVTVAVRSPAPSDCTCVDVAVRDPIAADVVSTRAELLLSSRACRPTATHAASFASGTHETPHKATCPPPTGSTGAGVGVRDHADPSHVSTTARAGYARPELFWPPPP